LAGEKHCANDYLALVNGTHQECAKSACSRTWPRFVSFSQTLGDGKDNAAGAGCSGRDHSSEDHISRNQCVAQSERTTPDGLYEKKCDATPQARLDHATRYEKGCEHHPDDRISIAA